MRLGNLTRKKIHHYNTPGHAHELTYSCYHKRDYLSNPKACDFLLEEIEKARRLYSFQLWAYVLMPNHVHLLIRPKKEEYEISKMLSGIKRYSSKRYGIYLKETNGLLYDSYLLKHRTTPTFTFWQPGGGFDRNLWNEKAIYDSIRYIEANPVRKKLAEKPEDWQWSSAFVRFHKKGVIPDDFSLPVLMVDPQTQRVGLM